MIVLVIVVLELVSYTSRDREQALSEVRWLSWGSEIEKLARGLVLKECCLCHSG